MRTVGGMVRVLVEFLVLWGSSALALIVLDRILDGITLDPSGFTPLPTLPAALVLALVFGLLNAALWPVMMRLMSWIGPVLLFVGVFVAGGVIMLLTLYLVRSRRWTSAGMRSTSRRCSRCSPPSSRAPSRPVPIPRTG